MKSILLFIFSLLASALIAQPTTLDMKQRYYMKGKANKKQLTGSASIYSATADEEGNYYYSGAAIVDKQNTRKGIIGKIDAETAIDKSYNYDAYTMYECLPVGENLFITSHKFTGKTSKNKKMDGGDIATVNGGHRLLYNENTENIIVFGASTKEEFIRPTMGAFNANSMQGEFYISQSKYQIASFADGEKLKNDFAALNNNIAIFVYLTQPAYNKESEASFGLLGFYDDVGKESGVDKIDVQKHLKEFVADFKPFTHHENKAYEKIYNPQYALSGVHAKEDGTFLITASFIHWTKTATGKVGYQKGILGVEYDFTKSNSIIDTWVVFPWEVREATSLQEKLEINPYYTYYVGGNDIAVFDQETGHLFAINSDLDACKKSDELGTCQSKSKELQKWLINNRLIAQIESGGEFGGFVNSAYPPQNGERKPIHLIQFNSAGSEMRIIKWNN